jgi:hypothetical protein
MRLSPELLMLWGLCNCGNEIFDKVLALTPGDLSPDYRKRNAKLLAMPRGGDYWAWKSRVV